MKRTRKWDKQREKKGRYNMCVFKEEREMKKKNK